MPTPQPEADLALGAAASLDAATRERIEAAAFRKLVAHLRERADVQNIDMMNLTGFCRNCMSRWYQEAAAEVGTTLETPAAREIIYGMDYKAWQTANQKDTTDAQKAAFGAAMAKHG